MASGGRLSFCKPLGVRLFGVFVEGDRVLVEWGGADWDAEISKLENDKLLVRYTNWSSHWDEWLAVDSIRLKSLIEADASKISSQRARRLDRGNIRKDQVDRKVPWFERRESEPQPATVGSDSSPNAIELNIHGSRVLTAALKNGRLLFKDLSTGLISWEFPQRVKQEVPAGFKVGTDLEGAQYYFNTVNGKSQYSFPSVAAATSAKNSDRMQTVSAPWEVLLDADGTPYYHNTETGAVSWEAAVDEKKKQVEAAAPVPKQEWAVHYTEDGFPFFHSATTGESVWEVPNQENWWEEKKPLVEKSLVGG